MGFRNSSKRAKLIVKKETLQRLQLRTLSDDELRQAPGGMSAGCSCDESVSIKSRC
jgi:hypothetical protein